MPDDFLQAKLLSSRMYPDFFPFEETDRVVNIGCGEGPQAIVYAGQYGLMAGIDINADRLITSNRVMRDSNIQYYHPICADVVENPLPNAAFEKSIAIDIIEHVKDPEALCDEIHRLLKDEGELLITFPVMYEKFRDLLSFVKRALGRKKRRKVPSEWNPDDHHHKHAASEWIALVERCGFRLVKYRATTMFPPLYLVGIPRFWFRIRLISVIDGFFCRVPVLKNLGQTLLCVFQKIEKR